MSLRLLIIGFLICIPLIGLAQIDYASLRAEMVKEQIQARGVTNRPTLRALQTVPRHLFVPEKYKLKAYEDRPLSIGKGQTISQPYMVAYMTAAIKPEPDFKVLEIGTGSGYQAAVLAEIVAKVYTIEIIPELGDKANNLFIELGYDNIITKIGDGYYGWPDEAPFDAIIVTAAPEVIPDAFIDQLKEGGRLIIPVGSQRDIQYLKMIVKGDKKNKAQNLFPVRFVPFTREGDH